MSQTTNLYQCRLCLKRTPTKVNVLAGDFPKMLEILTSIKVRENDGLPRYSCAKCALDVKTALIVKKRIIKAHKLLIESMKKKNVDVVEKKIIEALSENNSIKIIDASSVSNAKSALSADPSKSACAATKAKSLQRPIEFINVSEAALSVTPIKSEKNDVVKKINNYEEITLTAPKVEQVANNDEPLQRIFDHVMNTSKKTWTCEKCNIIFYNRISYHNHCGKHRRTLCKICNHVVRSDNFKKHSLLHTSGPTECNICGATCKNIESLRGHIFYQHKSAANEYVCEECGKHFRIKYKFELHKRKEHIGIRNFKCDICGKAFFTNGNLISHVNMTHKKLRPHICEFCGIGFSSAYALKTHKRQHTNERPFECEFCNEGFRQKVSLRSHLKSKHNIEEAKEYFCKECNKGFATNYALSIHARLHMTEKCEVCSESFAEKDYLKNHLKEVHNIPSDNSTEQKGKVAEV